MPSTVSRRPSSATRGFARWLAATVATIGLILATPSAAAAAQTANWGWTTDDDVVMSFFGGIPYVGCEKAKLTVPNSGSTGTVTAKTWSSIVVGVNPNCSWSTVPSSLNANRIGARTQVTRNGVLQGGCDTGTVQNSSGQGVISATGTCTKFSSADATWKLLGTYSWWDYDDTTWRSETIGAPTIVD